MTGTTIPYTPPEAILYAKALTDRRLGEVQADLMAEFEDAIKLAGEYAEHLAAGGDPTIYPQPDDRDRANHGLIRIAREAVFAMWNDTRPRKSVGYPWGQHQPFTWLIQERLLESLGQPVTVAELVQVRARGLKGTPATVAAAAWTVQVDTRGEIRVRKTKLDGKVAWVARLPVDGDDLADIAWREGVYSGTSLDEESVAEALKKPFKRIAYDYPKEA